MRHPARCGNGPLGDLLDAKGQIQRRALQPAEDLREVGGADADGLCEFVSLDPGRLEVCRELFHARDFIYQLTNHQPGTLAIGKFRIAGLSAIQEAWL